jgi:tripartite-type tricarboxylate transporter receptor subunit TctC
MRKINKAAVASLLALASFASSAFPDRPITVVVPYAPGGSTDVLARVLVDVLAKDLGQPVVVENLGGAGGTIGTAKVARSNKDGYTVLLHNMAVATAPSLYSKLPYDISKDLEAVALIADVPMILVRSKRYAPATLSQLVDDMKARPGAVNFAHAGVGATSHLCAILFSQATKTASTLVPYRGTGPALTDLLAGSVDVICDQPVATGPHIQAGGLVPYAISGDKRLPVLPNAPTFAEAGLKDFQPVVWHGMYVPKGTPAAVVTRLNKAVQTALDRPELVKRLNELGAEVPSQDRRTTQVAQSFTLAEVARWAPILKAAGAKAD